MVGKPARKRMHPKLATARAYYRLAAKAWRAGNSGEAVAYRKQADRYRDMYDRDMEARARREAQTKAYQAQVAARIAARKEATNARTPNELAPN